MGGVRAAHFFFNDPRSLNGWLPHPDPSKIGLACESLDIACDLLARGCDRRRTTKRSQVVARAVEARLAGPKTFPSSNSELKPVDSVLRKVPDTGTRRILSPPLGAGSLLGTEAHTPLEELRPCRTFVNLRVSGP